MKKILVLIGLLLTTNVYANVPTIETVSADNVVTTLNTNFSRISSTLGGNIEGSTDGGSTVNNIKADSVFEINMADDANPRVRDAELLSVTTDSTTAQNTYVYSGGVPADDTDLTSNISACVAYINGYRVSKAATSLTYTASRDNWVDLSQTGVYTITAVVVGAAEPSVAANSARLAKVTTDGTEITAITDEANRRLPGLVVPAHYRTGLVVSKDSATTLTVLPGTCEVNNSMISKTSTTTLTITTAGDWAGGSSLAAANTFGFVGTDSSGTLKLHTTAPTHDNYGVSTTQGKKRYATWSSTVYRVLGWFYMGTATNIDVASNLKDGDVNNTVMSNDNAIVANSATTLSEVAKQQFYSSGGNLLLFGIVSGDSAAGTAEVTSIWRRGSTNIPGSGSSENVDPSGENTTNTLVYLDVNRPQGTNSYSIMNKVASNSLSMRNRTIVIEEQ